MNGDAGDIYRWLLSTDPQSMIIKTVLIVLCFMLTVMASACRGAINGTSVNELRKRAEHDDSRAGKALNMMEQENRFLQCCDVCCFFHGAAAMVLSTCTFGAWIENGLNAVQPVGFAVVFIVGMFLLYAFGVMVSSKSGEQKGEEMLLTFGGVYRFLLTGWVPFAALCDLLSDMMLSIFGNYTEKNQNQRAEEEILMMVDEGEENGVIEGNTKDMIENVFEFDDTTVGEIMTHRKDVVAVRLHSQITDAARAAMESGKSRLPVFGEDIDEIVGILYVKDLLKYVSTNAPTEQISQSMLKEAVFVPESKRCSEMFEYMTEKKTQIAVVVDEFGGTGGIITMEDLLESIVGNIQDEYDNEDEEIKRLDERSFTVSGATSLDEISDLTGLDFEDEENDTVAGIMLDRMGHIPKNGEHPSIVINGTRFTVQEVEDRRISKVLIVKARKHT